MKHIQSSANPLVKQWRKLLTRKERDKTGLFLIEGIHLVEEALKNNAEVEMIIIGERVSPPSVDYGSVPVVVVTDEIIKLLADTEAPQGVFAVCRQQAEHHLQDGKVFLFIDSVQDPGNLGTMIRTADAAGADAVIVGTGSVDIYNPKVLRSAQGSHFHLPIIRSGLDEWFEIMAERKIPVFGTSLQGAVPYKEIERAESFALLVGNEGSGVRKELLEKTTKNLYIPIRGKSESLNVAVAAGILMYHLTVE